MPRSVRSPYEKIENSIFFTEETETPRSFNVIKYGKHVFRGYDGRGRDEIGRAVSAFRGHSTGNVDV
jgi:hypothetical protein